MEESSRLSLQTREGVKRVSGLPSGGPSVVFLHGYTLNLGLCHESRVRHPGGRVGKEYPFEFRVSPVL